MNEEKVILKPPEIINAVADYFKMSPEDVISTERYRDNIKAKHIAMYGCWVFTKMSLSHIGLCFNGKDHSTVIHAIRSVKDQCDVYPEYKKELDKILFKLGCIPTKDDTKIRRDYNTELI